MMREDFVPWLVEIMSQRGWTQAEFARQAGMTGAQISRILSGENTPGIDESLVGIARAVRVPVEDVLRRAGVLPQSGELLPEVRDWNERLRALEAGLRVLTIQAMETTLQAVEGRKPGRR